MNSIDLDRNRTVGRGCSILDSCSGNRDNSFDETNTPRQRREGRGGNATEVHPEIWKCSGSQGLLPLIGYLIRALSLLQPPVPGPHNIRLLSSRHPSKAYSRIIDLLKDPNIRLGQTQLAFNEATSHTAIA